MLMDEPFGALDPITRERLQDEFLRLQRESRKTVIFVTHDIDEAIKMGDRIAILREGGVLAQYDTPDAILAAPGGRVRRALRRRRPRPKRLALRTLADVELAPARGHRGPPAVPATASLREALSVMLTEAPTSRRVDDDGSRRASRSTSVGHLLADAVSGVRSARAGGPGHPDFGDAAGLHHRTTPSAGPGCRSTGATRSEPALVQHLELDRIAVGIGFAIAFAAALLAHRFRWFDTPIGLFTAFLYTIPSIALFEILLPITGITCDDGRDRAGRLHAADPLPQHPRRACAACPWRRSRRRAAWG